MKNLEKNPNSSFQSTLQEISQIQEEVQEYLDQLRFMLPNHHHEDEWVLMRKFQQDFEKKMKSLRILESKLSSLSELEGKYPVEGQLNLHFLQEWNQLKNNYRGLRRCYLDFVIDFHFHPSAI